MSEFRFTLLMFQEAISEAERYGRKHPRRWLAKHGEIAGVGRELLPRGKKDLSSRYLSIKREIEALIPRTRSGEQEVIYRIVR